MIMQVDNITLKCCYSVKCIQNVVSGVGYSTRMQKLLRYIWVTIYMHVAYV